MALKLQEKIVRLEFGEDWIDVRAERKYRDTVNAQRAAATSVQATGRGKDAAAARIDFDLSQFNLALLTSMIVAWSDTDTPITEESVQELPDSVAQEVLSVILGTRDEDDAPLEINFTSASESPGVSSPPGIPEERTGLDT